MYIFLDTEFTRLDGAADLISIGLAAPGGEVFYAESAEFDLADCSDFTLAEVLPKLDAPERFTLDEIGDQVKAWLAPFGGVTMLTDAPLRDWPHVQRIFQTVGWPSNLRHKPGNLAAAEIWQALQAASARFLAGAREHHALDDAIANRQAYQEIRRQRPMWRPRF